SKQKRKIGRSRKATRRRERNKEKRSRQRNLKAGRLTLRQAAQLFGVPKSSLSDRVSGRVSSDCVLGQRTLLTPADEDSLAEYCLYSASYGFPLTKPQVLAHALAIYNERHQAAPRTVLGQTWWINFREWHHHRLTARTPDIIDRGRASCAKRGPIEEYFRLLTTTLEEHGLREKPRQIYNCDETGFQLDSSRRKVIVPRGTKHAYRQAQGTRDHITILACLNAGGEDVPPFIIYKGGYPGGPYNKKGVPDALYGKSPAGYIDSELFRKWFVGHFLKFAMKERPLLLLMDGHQSHLDPELVRAAQREGVILLCLPPHTSHILQPLDVSFFGPLKADFSGVSGDLSAMSHSFLVSKKEFSRVLRDSYQRVKDRRLEGGSSSGQKGQRAAAGRKHRPGSHFLYPAAEDQCPSGLPQPPSPDFPSPVPHPALSPLVPPTVPGCLPAPEPAC
uniref:HTH CENPB-type domain-containing protein n=1 Tax=Cyclopterus lumpus TaxID=8103 RepID=A0A8C2ZHE7_CYCLU